MSTERLDVTAYQAADGRERALTTDGEKDREYGASPFSPTVLLNKIGVPHLPPAVAWSPDSTIFG